MNIKIDILGNDGVYKSDDTIRFVYNHFSVENPNPNASLFSKRKYVITPTGRFNIGLWGEIHSYVASKFPNYDIQISDQFLEKYSPVIDFKDILSIDGYTYYDYQYEAINQMLLSGRGLVVLATAAGKTLIMAGFCKTYLQNYPDGKILIIVPNLNLLNQTYRDFTKDFKLSGVSRWSSEYPIDLNSNILIANSGILVSDIKKTLKYVGSRDVLIMDECHKLKHGNKINKIVHNMDTDIRFGLTGTIPKTDLDKWNILGKIGPLLYTKKSYELRDEFKSISEVEVKIVKLKHKNKPKKYRKKVGEEFKPTGQYDNEIDFLYNSEWRNSFISNIANKLDGNVLVLVDRIFHGEHLVSKISSSSNKNAVFICGETPVNDRDSIIRSMEDNSNIICVAMDTIFSTGISVKNLKYVIFVCIGKSYTKILQSIGRSLRLHEDKKRAYIFDISDLTKYSSKHLNERLEFYNEEKINYEIKQIEEK